MGKNKIIEVMEKMKKISLNVFLGYLVLTIVAIGTSLTGIYISNKIESKSQQNHGIVDLKVQPSQYPDYDAIKGKDVDTRISRVNITSDCNQTRGCVSDKSAKSNFGDITKKYSVKGKFSRSYLYVEALVDYKRPLTSWDDIYFKINEIGGHLIPDGNVLPTPPGNSSTYLYNMSNILYYASLSDKRKKHDTQKRDDMFSLLTDGATIKVIAAVSSNRPGRVLKEVSIYYECFEDSKCSILETK